MWAIIFCVVAAVLLYQRASLMVANIAFAVTLSCFAAFSDHSIILISLVWGIFIGLAVILNYRPLRRRLVSLPMLRAVSNNMPSISTTEREALESGTVGWEGKLFAGAPDWQQWFATPALALTTTEQAFLDGPVDELCRMIDDWEITHIRGDLPPHIWNFLKEKQFFAMIIPKQYGGLGFSALAHSQVIVKIASRSVTVASTVTVPNSLGPAELLLHYGTSQQKDYYLPRLATSQEIPCFALTAPEAGSDASAIPDVGIVCHGEFQGKSIIGIRVTWHKRYITLAPVATVLGLAFRLFDPEHLIGTQEDVGITCALIPVDTQGVKIGRRHLPLNTPFQNGPTQGENVFIPLDWIIGGVKMAGQGWRMLMECLAIGRGISLPASSTGSAKVFALSSGAYARIRQQFGVPIGNFEGIQQALARIAANTYTMDATRLYAAQCVDAHERPAIGSAIAKYHVTEMARAVAIDAMDLHGGKGICIGPNNYLANAYQGIPISITVEGANIMTRNLIIFGQGVVCCHPYLLREIKAIATADATDRLQQFDELLFAHIGFASANVWRSVVLGLTSGYSLIGLPKIKQRLLQRITRYATNFALVTDVCLFLFGGTLKRKENISARLGDLLSYLYLSCCVLKHFHNHGATTAEATLVDWLCQKYLYQFEAVMAELLANLPQRALAKVLYWLIFPWGRRATLPSDRLTKRVAELLLSPNETRQRLTEGSFVTDCANNHLAQLEQTLKLVVAVEPLEQRLKTAVKAQQIKSVSFKEQVYEAQALQLISALEAEQLLTAYAAKMKIIAVDDFGASELAKTWQQHSPLTASCS